MDILRGWLLSKPEGEGGGVDIWEEPSLILEQIIWKSTSATVLVWGTESVVASLTCVKVDLLVWGVKEAGE